MSAEVAVPDGQQVVEFEGVGTLVVPTDLIENYPALSPEFDLAEMLEDTLGPGGVLRLSDLTRIKVPSAELSRFMIPDEEGEPQPTAELRGIPVGQTSRRSWWVEKNPSGKPPDCSSRDLITGVGRFGAGSTENPTGACENCPMSQIGSAETGTNGSACKEQRLLFVLTDRELTPFMFVVPPGSLQNHKRFGIDLVAKRGVLGPVRPDLGLNAKGRPIRGSAWFAIEIGLSLEKATNPAGQDYNKITFKQVRKLSDDEKLWVAQYSKWVEEMIAAQADQLDQVAAETAGGGGGALPDDEVGDDELPADEVDLSDVGTSPKAGARR